MPAFDRLEDIEGSKTSVQRSGYHDGGLPAREQINTDEIINSIGYGPLQVCMHAIFIGNGRQLGVFEACKI